MDFDIIKKYRHNKYNKLLLLDYSGVIMNIEERDNLPASDKTIRVLKKLLQKQFLKIVILVGSEQKDIRNFFDILSIDCKTVEEYQQQSNSNATDKYDIILAIGNYKNEKSILKILPEEEKIIKVEVGGYQTVYNNNYQFENIDEVLMFLELLSI